MEALSRLMPVAKVRSSGTPLALAPSNQGSSAEAFLFRIICAKACAKSHAALT